MLKYISLITPLVLGVSTLVPNNAIAHHGVNGQFDMSSEVEVSGVVTNVRFVNPHSYVYFKVAEADGTINNWQCDLLAGTSLKRKGWTEDMFAAGTKITIKGQPARDGTNTCHTETITFENGTMLARDDNTENFIDTTNVSVARVLRLNGKPNLSGSWIIQEQQRSARPQRGGEGMGPAMGMGNGGMAGGGMGQNRELPPSERFDMTEANLKASSGFMREDNPRFHCQATNVIRDWTFGQNGQNVSEIEQTEEMIIIRYGFMDIVRKIYMKMESHPEDITPSRAGHSIGHWDKDVLVVDTVGFEQGYLDAGPASVAMHSEHLHVVERFTMSEDGLSIVREWELDDPLFLNSKSTGEDKVNYTNTAFVSYNCEDLSN